MSSEDGGGRWYQASIFREDTHCGRLDNGAVHARCGVVFKPLKDLFNGREAGPVEVPMQAGQSCPKCRATLGKSIAEVEKPPPNHIRLVLEPLDEKLATRQPGSTLATLLPPPTPPAQRTAPIAQPGANRKPSNSAVQPQSRWYARSKKPGDTHWVLRTPRGAKIAACEETLQRGRWVKHPTPKQLCPVCNAQRPR